MRRTPTGRLAAVLAAAALVVGGCAGTDATSSAPDEVIESNLEDIPSDKVEVDVEDGNVTVEGDDSTFATTDELPDDFPDEVPLIDGTIRSAGGQSDDSGGQLWLVQMAVDGSAETVFADAVDRLEGAGYERGLDNGGTVGTWSNGTWEVGVAVIDAGDSVMAQYSVTPSPQ